MKYKVLKEAALQELMDDDDMQIDSLTKMLIEITDRCHSHRPEAIYGGVPNSNYPSFIHDSCPGSSPGVWCVGFNPHIDFELTRDRIDLYGPMRWDAKEFLSDVIKVLKSMEADGSISDLGGIFFGGHSFWPSQNNRKGKNNRRIYVEIGPDKKGRPILYLRRTRNPYRWKGRKRTGAWLSDRRHSWIPVSQQDDYAATGTAGRVRFFFQNDRHFVVSTKSRMTVSFSPSVPWAKLTRLCQTT